MRGIDRARGEQIAVGLLRRRNQLDQLVELRAQIAGSGTSASEYDAASMIL